MAAPEGQDLSEMSAEELVEHLNNAAPPGTPMTPEGEDAIRALEEQQLMDDINNLPAPGTEWTPDDRLDVSSPKNLIKNMYNQSARGDAPAPAAPEARQEFKPSAPPPAPSVP
jgi:hypothetical protein